MWLCKASLDFPSFFFLLDKPSTGEVEVFCDKVLNTIDLPEVGAWVVVQVTSCFNPFHFWIRFPLGVDPLEDIFKKGNNLYYLL